MRRLVLTAACLLLVGCTAHGSSGVTKPTRATPLPTVTLSVTPTTPLSPSAGAVSPVVATGHGWQGSHLDGPLFPAGSCHVGGTAATPRPDVHCTPGATDAAVSGGTITTTICVRGYTATVRPPVSLTAPAKRESAREYGYTGAGEYDHLIPLELGGASDTRNLWVEPGKIPNAKDAVENTLKAMVCAHQVTLLDAQRAIAADWSTALATVRAHAAN